MVGQFIDTFWRKSFIGELRRAKKLVDDDTQWSLVYHGKEHSFQFVWLQGICVKVSDDCSNSFSREWVHLDRTNWSCDHH